MNVESNDFLNLSKFIEIIKDVCKNVYPSM